jgi:hypothetical protein
LFDIEPEYPDVGDISKPGAPVNGVRRKRIVIARQYDNGIAVTASHLRRALEKLEWLAMIIKSIAGQ